MGAAQAWASIERWHSVLKRCFVVVGEFQEAVAAAQVELLAHVLAVRLDRANGTTQDLGDFLARLVVGDELEDTALSVGEGVETRLLATKRLGLGTASQQQARQSCANECFAFIHAAHGRDQILDGVFLEHVSVYAEVERFVQEIFVFVHREQHELNRGLSLDELSRGLQAGQPGHVDVEDGDVRPQLVDELERFLAVAGLADQAQPGVWDCRGRTTRSNSVKRRCEF
jgi:hypothetical protein